MEGGISFISLSLSLYPLSHLSFLCLRLCLSSLPLPISSLLSTSLLFLFLSSLSICLSVYVCMYVSIFPSSLSALFSPMRMSLDNLSIPAKVDIGMLINYFLFNLFYLFKKYGLCNRVNRQKLQKLTQYNSTDRVSL